MVPALEGEHQALALLGIADELEAVLDGLAATDIEMHAAFLAKLLLCVARDHRRQLDLLAMQVLACDLGEPVELPLRRVDKAGIAISEVNRRVPHLEIQILAPFAIEEERAFAAIEDLGRLHVVNGVAP